MNHDYKSVKEMMITQGIDIPESYIEKALREHHLEEFPEAGLSDIGLSKLVKTATDIYHSEIDLTPRKPAKEKPLKKVSLESQIVKEDLKRVGKNAIKVGKIITYPTIGTSFLFPTMFRKVRDYDDNNSWGGIIKGFFNGWAIGTNLVMYLPLIQINPKLIPYTIAAQLFTNAASLGYEWARSIKKRTEEKEQKTPRFDRDPAGHLEGMYYEKEFIEKVKYPEKKKGYYPHIVG